MEALALGAELSLQISRDDIAQEVQRLAREIRQDYSGKHPLLVGILNGSFIFLADLVRELAMPLNIDFVRARSYRGTESTGNVKLNLEDSVAVTGRDVLIVEDIVDTGITVNRLMEVFRGREPASLKLCALLDKPSKRVVPIEVDYLGFTIPDHFVVGYGMDMDQEMRHLADICVVGDVPGADPDSGPEEDSGNP